MTFIVSDLDAMETILTEVLGATRIYDSGEATFSLSRERFFDVAGLWVATMEGEPLPSRTYNHIAFKIDESAYDSCLSRIKALGLDVRESRPRVEGEGRSIYFHDGTIICLSCTPARCKSAWRAMGAIRRPSAHRTVSSSRPWRHRAAEPWQCGQRLERRTVRP
jgi:catechol 2,3-dioxygenase-like lactoylglutathione lyase family enzyme